jgi:hypothetical protein
MNRLLTVAMTLGLISVAAFCLQTAGSAESSSPAVSPNLASQSAKVLHEYKGVKLGLKRAQVNALLGKPENSSENTEDYRLGGDDSMTVHYENGEVRTIQIVFFDPKNAPAWSDVVGDAEVNETESGARHARKVVGQENFWVSIYQSKDGQTTRITISR